VPDSTPPLGPQEYAAAARLLASAWPAAAGLGEIFARHGHQLAIVGGSVRDVFLRRRSADLDLTTDARPERVLEITQDWADSVWPVGVAFGTVGLRKGQDTIEITTYRSEEYDPGSRKPAVSFGRTLEGDLARRDFTINAMAARLPSFEVVDLFGGLADLRDKVLRTPGRPGESLSDDPLRTLRAARFAAQLGFTLAPDLAVAMTEFAPRLDIVSPERISGELTKLMLAAEPVRGIMLLTETGVAEEVLPEVPRLQLEADEHYRHKDVYQHSLTVLGQAIGLEARYGLEQDLVLRLAALLHDIGKPKTRSLLPGGRVAFHHHEVIGARMAKARLTALRFPGAVVADVSRLIELHLRFHGYGTGEWTDSAVRRYVADAGPLLTRLHALTRADCTTRNKAKAQRLARTYDDLERRIAVLAEEEELARLRPDLDGNEIMRILGIGPGPQVGQARRFLLDLRIERGPLGPEQATYELLRWAGLSAPAAEPGDGAPESGGGTPPDAGDAGDAGDGSRT
jgi:poly(A) polymerase